MSDVPIKDDMPSEAAAHDSDVVDSDMDDEYLEDIRDLGLEDADWDLARGGESQRGDRSGDITIRMLNMSMSFPFSLQTLRNCTTARGRCSPWPRGRRRVRSLFPR